MHRNEELNTVYESIGINIKTSSNTSVYSVLDGVVSYITYVRDFGNIIIINHGGKYYTVYSNVENIYVSEDEYVDGAYKIATVAKNQSEAYVFHFEIWENQNKLNPQTWLRKK